MLQAFQERLNRFKEKVTKIKINLFILKLSHDKNLKPKKKKKTQLINRMSWLLF